MKKRILKIIGQVKKRFNQAFSRLNKLAFKYPLLSFFGTLVLLLGLIYIGDQLRQPEEKEVIEIQPKKVSTYSIGAAPKVSVNARIEKSGVVTIVAQTSGIVQKIYKQDGEDINKGQWLVSLSTNYQGGNAMSVSRQISQKQYEHARDTFDLEKDIIAKKREQAEKNDSNSDELQRIAEESKSRTEQSITDSKSAIDYMDTTIEGLEGISTVGNYSNAATDENLIASLKSQKANLVSGLNSAEQALRRAELDSDADKPPAQLSDITKDITLKQLELEEKSLTLDKEVKFLNYRLAQVNEALMFPAAPFASRIERIHVRVGQAVNPGDSIATLAGTEQTITAVALAPKQLAQNISRWELSRLHLDGSSLELFPSHIAAEPTNNRLFAVLFSLPSGDELNYLAKGYDLNLQQPTDFNLTEGEYIQIDIPVGVADTSSSFPFIPIDAIYQTQDSSFVFLSQDGVVETREVSLGQIFGRFVEVFAGLNANDQVILDRNVVSGEKVETS